MPRKGMDSPDECVPTHALFTYVDFLSSWITAHVHNTKMNTWSWVHTTRSQLNLADTWSPVRKDHLVSDVTPSISFCLTQSLSTLTILYNVADACKSGLTYVLMMFQSEKPSHKSDTCTHHDQIVIFLWWTCSILNSPFVCSWVDVSVSEVSYTPRKGINDSLALLSSCDERALHKSSFVCSSVYPRLSFWPSTLAQFCIAIRTYAYAR